MAKIHNQISRGDLTAAVTRALGVTKPDTGIERYSETVNPTLDLWGRPEFALLRGETLFSQVINIPAVAAEFGGGAIVNPANSGLIALCYAIIRSAGAISWQWGLATEAAIVATYATTFVAGANDGRKYKAFPAGGGCGLNVSFGSDGAAQIIVQLDTVNTPAAIADERPFHVPIILRPGQAALVEAASVVTSGVAVVFGWARKALPGELVVV